jgi:hypothetical protein
MWSCDQLEQKEQAILTPKFYFHILWVDASGWSEELFQGWRTEHICSGPFRSNRRNLKLIFDKSLPQKKSETQRISITKRWHSDLRIIKIVEWQNTISGTWRKRTANWKMTSGLVSICQSGSSCRTKDDRPVSVLQKRTCRCILQRLRQTKQMPS